MRVFVAGATGVLGRRLVAECTDRGHDVVGLTRDDRGDRLVRERGGEPHRGDVFDRASLVDGAGDADVVVHVVDDEPVTYAAFLRTLADRLGAPSPRRVPAWLARPFVGEHLLRLLVCPMPTTASGSARRSTGRRSTRRSTRWSSRWSIGGSRPTRSATRRRAASGPARSPAGAGRGAPGRRGRPRHRTRARPGPADGVGERRRRRDDVRRPRRGARARVARAPPRRPGVHGVDGRDTRARRRPPLPRREPGSRARETWYWRLQARRSLDA
jgi:hypothetical protein